MAGIEPYRIAVPERDIAVLRRRLSESRWPNFSTSAAAWDRGPDVGYMHRLVRYWHDRFDWRIQESAINAFPQFRADIDDYTIHFLHQSNGAGAVPLVLTHGWPGSLLEFLPLIRTLQSDDAPPFAFIVPTIPGFGYSGLASAAPPSLKRVAELWLALMDRLGYARFMVQGGDFGAGIATWMARLAPQRVAGIHLNFLPGSYRPALSAANSASRSQAEQIDHHRRRWYDEEGAYAHLQRTRPWTPAYGLSDSPIGLAAWLVEKFYHWSDRTGTDDEPPFPFDQLLANISLYWFTNTIRSSMEFYRTANTDPLALGPDERIAPPLAYAAFPHETWDPPESWIARGYNLVRYRRMPRGGHFAALEAPEDLAQDIREFARSLLARR